MSLQRYMDPVPTTHSSSRGGGCLVSFIYGTYTLHIHNTSSHVMRPLFFVHAFGSAQGRLTVANAAGILSGVTVTIGIRGLGRTEVECIEGEHEKRTKRVYAAIIIVIV